MDYEPFYGIALFLRYFFPRIKMNRQKDETENWEAKESYLF